MQPPKSRAEHIANCKAANLAFFSENRTRIFYVTDKSKAKNPEDPGPRVGVVIAIADPEAPRGSGAFWWGYSSAAVERGEVFDRHIGIQKAIRRLEPWHEGQGHHFSDHDVPRRISEWLEDGRFEASCKKYFSWKPGQTNV